ncbi:hypothetical protein [Heyndrickxia acidicola]|uniref:Uncharacterized protein n=1 Tax=Heyndrickxia acidicola TaxID=209389 RepID=A0ABU6MM29_9BACI|nr:hypothetical protein [Heyndrickxia acidicola]MED1205744.1 hypothetical protein [Heyndrickxia acidicola]
MSLKGVFNYFLKNDSTIKQLKRKISELEKIIEKNKSVQNDAIPNNEKPLTPEGNIQPPIVVEKLNVERLVIDKVELNNNFGQLGIKELKGRLNIGATYGEGGIMDFLNKENKELKRNNTVNSGFKTEKKNVEPKININSR